MPVVRWRGHPAYIEQMLDPLPQRCQLLTPYDAPQLLTQLAAQVIEQPGEPVAFAVGQLLAGEAPQDCAQLLVRVQGEAVVDGIQVTVAGDECGTLAVGVVEHHVEQGDVAQLVLRRVRHDERPVVLVALNFVGILPSSAMLKAWRPAIFLIFVFSAMMMPTPDPFSMMILALPFTFFYFCAIGVSRLFDRRRERDRPQ